MHCPREERAQNRSRASASDLLLLRPKVDPSLRVLVVAVEVRVGNAESADDAES